jgi:trk system potassium uptake protein TrkA
VALVQVSPHEGWVGHPVTDLEAATGARVGMLTRFGTGVLPTVSTLIQAGDSLHAFVTDEQANLLHDVAGRPPEGGRQ